MKISPIKIWRRQKELKHLLGKKGKIITGTTIYVPGSHHSDKAPFPVVLVELENKHRLVGQLTDYRSGDLTTGTKVIAVLRKTRSSSKKSVIVYGISFRPL
ncbi:hypothetical protein A3F34_02760 [Candidatus Roizmanbacteria bacterium RIFCSPHIGHO2_12_FULL_44_10]|uniref:ChsH2 C-terminal OB-fold domain-containing protein n=1 Tax=Candidatus Roizmanbacteria bacterium RIFCSPHIGHO2_12_FULL_44_10 TaxID=1802054 RepID=A0A1F7I7R0_9BACT|nr:MAG: hypothetical protein A3F34_02760 [Candidatus Roizmanbacteria bacterium RIFCSPHIGHO2_12_FULL_44_10]